MSFDQLNIIEPILRALEAEGYVTPTPIQEQAIPPLLLGRDVLGSAQTGTGKTAAFAIPILQQLTAMNLPAKGFRPIRTLILTPTRELALQIKESFDGYGRYLSVRNAVIFGGVGQAPQTDALKAGVDVLVATPGRLLDLMDQGFVHLESLTVFVLDEADRMLDMGFIHDVKKVIAKLPAKRQTMLFSATMPQEIAELAQTILRNPVRIAVVPVETTVDAIDQKVYFVAKKNKTRLLVLLLENPKITSALVFSRTKHGANKIVKELTLAGLPADAIHGNKSQTARQQALGDFKAKKTRILVATDIAARGLDIDHLSHVINYDLPEVPETYIHRIGRTGRAGLAGDSISFCDVDELPLLRDIVKHIKRPIPIVRNHPHAESYPDPLSVTGAAKSPKQMSDDEPREPKNFSRHDAKNEKKAPTMIEKKESVTPMDKPSQPNQKPANPNPGQPRQPQQNQPRPQNPQNQPRPQNPQNQQRPQNNPAQPSRPAQNAPQGPKQTPPNAMPKPAAANPSQPGQKPLPKPQIKKPNHPEKAYDPADFVMLEKFDTKPQPQPQNQKKQTPQEPRHDHQDHNRKQGQSKPQPGIDKSFPEPLPVEKPKRDLDQGDPLWEPEVKPAAAKPAGELPGGWKRFDPTKLPGYKAPELMSFPDEKKTNKIPR